MATSFGNHTVLATRNATGVEKIPYCFRKFPFLLQNNRELKTMLLGFLAVFVHITAPYHDESHSVVCVFRVELRQVRCKLIARPAIRVAENQEQAAPRNCSRETCCP